MTIRGEITLEDYRKVSKGNSRQLIFVIALMMINFCLVSPLGLHWFNWGVPVVFLFLSLVIAALAFGERLFPMSEERFLKIKALQGPREIEMNADGIAFSSPGTSFTERWEKHFRTYSIGTGYTILHEAGNTCHIFPKRWFTDEQYGDFQTYLRNSLGKPQN